MTHTHCFVILTIVVEIRGVSERERENENYEVIIN
jgi:hypothetical protein